MRNLWTAEMLNRQISDRDTVLKLSQTYERIDALPYDRNNAAFFAVPGKAQFEEHIARQKEAHAARSGHFDERVD